MSSTFVLSTLALLMFASSFVLVLPRIWQRREQTETNIDWLRLRQAELPLDAIALREEAALRLMEEGEFDAAVALADRPRRTWAGQLMGIGLMVAGVWWLYQQLGGWEDVQIAGELASLEQATPEDVLVLIDRIELRAEQRQANTDYALLLAEYHLTGNNPAKAVPYLERLIEAGAASPEILGKASQAEFLSSDRVLSPTARGRAEQALSIDPAQPAALATLGMAAFEEADYRRAIFYWQRLRALEAPGSPGHTMLGQVIERASRELGEPVEEPARGAAKAKTPSETSTDGGVVVQVSLPDGEQPPEGAAVFVLARPEGAAAGMPIAVVRVESDSWPLQVALTDATSMAGQLLSDFGTVSIEAQVSKNGQPGRQNALFWGRVDIATVGSGEPVQIRLNRD
ncbi:MAG: tetratricopeptide repeat protein [Luminiphilus sp.]